jgi:N-hydroxyarylamine O-acetyltransferase
MNDQTVIDYLGRIGAKRPGALDAEALSDLHRRHLLTVPFENLSIHLGEPISLAADDLMAKVVYQRRGGFCYELNGAFALLLTALGARVERVAARVYGQSGLGPPFDHLALLVHLPDGSGPWLADVGFGSHSDFPLHFARRDEQRDPAGAFVLTDAEAGDVDVAKDGAPQYRIERRERSLDEFVPTCWWQQTAPDSHFRQGTICSMLTSDGRVSIAGRTLIRTSGGTRTEQPLDSDDELLAAYRDNFGVSLGLIPDKLGRATA